MCSFLGHRPVLPSLQWKALLFPKAQGQSAQRRSCTAASTAISPSVASAPSQSTAQLGQEGTTDGWLKLKRHRRSSFDLPVSALLLGHVSGGTTGGVQSPQDTIRLRILCH